MATFSVTGLEDLQREFIKLGAGAKKAVPAMLEAGGDVLKKAQEGEAAKLNRSGRGTGRLAGSIKIGKVKPTKGKPGAQEISVYPGGIHHVSKRSGSKVRNAEVGFVQEYGRSGMPGTSWMSKAYAKSEAAIDAAMLKEWEKHNGG